MTIRITRLDGTDSRATLKLEGRLVAEWAPFVERECAALASSVVHVKLDLSGVRFVDSAGVDALLRLSDAGVEIRNCPDSVASVLEGEGVPVARDDEDGNDIA
jgi:anti-anti-sigma regulatory factor